MKKTRYAALTLLFLSVFLSLAAQSDPAQSGYIYTHQTHNDVRRASRSIFLCSDNSVVVFSDWDNHHEVHHSDNIITKLDPAGILLWERDFSYGENPFTSIVGVDVDAEDNVTFIYQNGTRISLHTVSSSGTVSPVGSPTYPPHLISFNKALRTDGGDIVAVGRIGYRYKDASSRAACYYRFSAQGDTLATAYWTDSFNYPGAYDLALMDNGNLLIACNLLPNLNSILEVDPDGGLINRYDFPGVGGWTYFMTISREPNTQNHIVAYSTADGISIDRFSDGSLEHLFSIPSTVMVYMGSMIVEPDYIVLCGARDMEGVLAKVDWNGVVEWTWSYPGDNSSDYVVYGAPSKSLLAVDDSDCVYWTWCNDYYSQAIFKLLPNGQVANQDDVQAPAANLLTAYPNPMKSHLAIKADSSLHDDSVNVYNIRGELIRQLKLTDGETLWDGKHSSGFDCPSGIYLLRSNNNRNQIEKISKIN